MQFAALLWDMDGTLFDTYPLTRQNVQEAFAAYDVTVDPVQVAQLLTLTFSHCIETLAAQHHLDVEPLRAKYDVMLQTNPPKQPPFPGVKDVCERVMAAGGKNLIMTHRDFLSLGQFLDHNDMRHLFADMITVDQGYPRKPDPTAFLTVTERNGIDPAHVLAVGDRTLDMQAAINAGMHTCFFAPQDFPGGAPRPDVPVDMVIGSYAELAQKLGI